MVINGFGLGTGHNLELFVPALDAGCVGQSRCRVLRLSWATVCSEARERVSFSQDITKLGNKMAQFPLAQSSTADTCKSKNRPN